MVFGKKNGFSLIELLMVIVIISVMSLITLPLFGNFGTNARLNSVAKSVASYLRLARTLAITQNIRHAVIIYSRSSTDEAMNNHIVIVKEDAEGDVIVEKVYSPPSLAEIPDISGNSDFTRIEFTPQGTTGNARSVHIAPKKTKISGSPYDPTANYSSTAQAFYKERYKCQTVTVTGSGRVRVYPYGRNTPFASNEIE